jgi:hypothetical protein
MNCEVREVGSAELRNCKIENEIATIVSPGPWRPIAKAIVGRFDSGHPGFLLSVSHFRSVRNQEVFGRHFLTHSALRTCCPMRVGTAHWNLLLFSPSGI